MRRRWTESRGSISARGLVPFLDTLFNLLFALLAINAANAAASSEFLRLRLPLVEQSQEGAASPGGLVIAVDADGSIRPAGTDVVLLGFGRADQVRDGERHEDREAAEESQRLRGNPGVGPTREEARRCQTQPQPADASRDSFTGSQSL